MILSKGTTAVSISGAKSFRVRYAVVSVPGTAMRVFFTSSSVSLRGGDDHGAVAFADAAAAGHQGVLVLQVGIGVEGDGGDVVEGLVDGAVVQRLDVGEGVGELVAGDADLVGGQAVEHEGVVGVGAVGDVDLLNCGVGGGHDSVILGRVRGIRDAARLCRFRTSRDVHGCGIRTAATSAAC